MDRVDAMQAFARVVEAGSFTKAAATMHMSKTSVTQLVQQLEARLRERLLNRTTRIVDIIGESVDCVVRGGEITEQSLVARHIGDLELGVYASRSYLERAGTPTHPPELGAVDHNTVGFLWSRTGKAFPYALQRDEERIEAQGRPLLTVDDGNAYLAAGIAGLGILWLPQYMAKPHRATGELLPLFEGWSMTPMPMYVAFPPNRHVSSKLRVFIDWVISLMTEHAPVVERG